MGEEARMALILAELKGSIKDAQTELADADQQTADLVAKIVEAQIERQDQLIAAANEATWRAAEAWMASHNAVFTPSPNHSTKYPMVWPAASGSITQPFGCTSYTFEPAPPQGYSCPSGTSHFHTGIDVANAAGTPIRAADDGVVAVTDDSMLGSHEIGYGKHVILVHRNGVMTLYGHLQGWVVNVGDTVTQGQVIGFMGSTGNSTGPHVHFEVRINDTPDDPSPFLPPNGPNDFHQ